MPSVPVYCRKRHQLSISINAPDAPIPLHLKLSSRRASQRILASHLLTRLSPFFLLFLYIVNASSRKRIFVELGFTPSRHCSWVGRDLYLKFSSQFNKVSEFPAVVLVVLSKFPLNRLLDRSGLSWGFFASVGHGWQRLAWVFGRRRGPEKRRYAC